MFVSVCLGLTWVEVVEPVALAILLNRTNFHPFKVNDGQGDRWAACGLGGGRGGCHGRGVKKLVGGSFPRAPPYLLLGGADCALAIALEGGSSSHAKMISTCSR